MVEIATPLFGSCSSSTVIVPPGLRRVKHKVTTSCSSKSAKEARSEIPEASILSAFSRSPALTSSRRYRRNGVVLAGRGLAMF